MGVKTVARAHQIFSARRKQKKLTFIVVYWTRMFEVPDGAMTTFMSSPPICPLSSSSSKIERRPLLPAKNDDEEMGDHDKHFLTSITRRNSHNVFIQYGTMIAIGCLCLLISIVCVWQSSAQQHHLLDQDISSLKFQGQSSLPHFVFVLADDLGWNAIGYQDFDMSFATPTLTQLAGDGIILSQYYTMEMCTPARGALLTGRYPLTIGMQYGVVNIDRPWGLDLSEQLLASALRDEGYKTHIVGKWHLGHHSPRYLPTARGFDTFTGYLSGNNYYYSKRNPVNPVFTDFLEANTTCYSPYIRENMHNYSTHFYGHRAIQIINEHDQGRPLFLYLSFQAVHDPFVDIVESRQIAKNLVSQSIRDQVENTVIGTKRKEVAYALAILDNTVGQIKDALIENKMMDNTYIIFASDNGGCYTSGGKNGPLRGTKGSLLEGGTKVDSFVFSPLIPTDRQGLSYKNVFHVTDWFPTMLEMAGKPFVPNREEYALDGVSHYASFLDDYANNGTAPREFMLYNSYYNVRTFDFDMWKTGSLAIRDDQYKLIHFYNNSKYSGWYDSYVENNDDDNMDMEECSALTDEASEGEFTYALFDLREDPYETNNLYDSIEDDSDLGRRKALLYQKITEFHRASRVNLASAEPTSKIAPKIWKEIGGDYIIPFVNVEEEAVKSSAVFYHRYPSLCTPVFEGHGFGLGNSR